jgi:hypothetical protein
MKERRAMTSDNIEKKTEVVADLSLPSISQEAWKSLVRERALDHIQARELAVTLEHLAADLKEEQARRDAAPRARVSGRIKRIEMRLRALIDEIDRSKADMAIILVDEARAGIGAAMSFAAIREAVGGEVVPDYLKAQLSAAGGDQKITSPLEMDAQTRSVREMLGRKYGPVILRNFLGDIHRPLAGWLQLERVKKRSVNDAQWVRWCLVYYLAKAAPGIIGKEAGISETGPFVELCAAVLRAMELPDTGVGKVAVDMVRQLRADEGRGPPRKPRVRRRTETS